MAGLSLSFGVSWLTIVDKIGAGIWNTIGWIKARRSTARDVAVGLEAKKARVEAAKVEEKRVATRVKPRIEAPAPVVEKSERVEKERQVPMFDAPKSGELPPLKLLDDPPVHEASYSQESLEAMSRLVELKLKDFGVEVEVVAVQPGPVVTRYEMRPAPGVKVSQISGLAKDLARSLSAISVRVVEVIPGKSVMGLEIPNEKREIVTLGEIIKSKAYDDVTSPLAIALGKDIGGAPVCADLAKMPHLLIAGTTGSGKSVGINAMILSLLYKSTAEHVRLIMIDPKMLELSVYEGIPHLLAPVVTDMKHAANALRWCVAEMERRYALMAALGVRNISGFNRKVKDATDSGKPIRDPIMTAAAANDPSIDQRLIQDLTPLPYIVVVIDELADMMMIVGKKVEELIARLAQKARASGVHLILATQRPSVDVITGLIKANIPCRIAFQVSARVDSRTILDQMGAESLLGHGDMLYLQSGTSVPTRVHGAFVSDAEVHRVVESLKKSGAPNYIEDVLEGPSMPLAGISGEPQAEGGDAEWRTGRAVRRSREDRHHRTQTLHLLRAAPAQDRLQPRRAAARIDGERRRRGSVAAEWRARNPRARTARKRMTLRMIPRIPEDGPHGIAGEPRARLCGPGADAARHLSLPPEDAARRIRADRHRRKGRAGTERARHAGHRATRTLPLGTHARWRLTATHGRRRQEPVVLRSRSRAGVGQGGNGRAHRDAGRAALWRWQHSRVVHGGARRKKRRVRLGAGHPAGE